MATMSQPRGVTGRQVVVKPELGVGPVALVGLVADGEVEAGKPAFDGMAHQLVQMRPARAEARQLAVVIARQHQVVGIAEGQTEIGRPPMVAPTSSRLTWVSALDVVIGGDIEKEFAIARPREDVLDAHAGECARLLRDQVLQRARDVIRVLHVDEAHLAVFGKMLELAAFAFAGRGRALRRVEFLPVVGERRDIGAARMRLAPAGRETDCAGDRLVSGIFCRSIRSKRELCLATQQPDDLVPELR